MGPRHGDEEVLGRYALHFHADHDGSRGSLVDGVVVSDSTGHAFAAHLSNGVTFRGCVAHDLVDDAFWWDLSLQRRGRDLVPVARHRLRPLRRPLRQERRQQQVQPHRVPDGRRPGQRRPRAASPPASRAASESSAGFHWPSHSRDDNTWTFVDNLAHNNRHSGIYFWQNGAPRTIVTRFTAYHCGQGIFAGSYSNLVSYRRCTIYACRNDGLVISALPVQGGPAHRRDDHLPAACTSTRPASATTPCASPSTSPGAGGSRGSPDRRSAAAGGRRSGCPRGHHPQLYDFVNCRMVGNKFWLADDVPVRTRLRVRPPGRRALRRPPRRPARHPAPGLERPRDLVLRPGEVALRDPWRPVVGSLPPVPRRARRRGP